MYLEYMKISINSYFQRIKYCRGSFKVNSTSTSENTQKAKRRKLNKIALKHITFSEHKKSMCINWCHSLIVKNILPHKACFNSTVNFNEQFKDLSSSLYVQTDTTTPSMLAQQC